MKHHQEDTEIESTYTTNPEPWRNLVLSILNHAIRSAKTASLSEKIQLAKFFRSELFQLYMNFLGYDIDGELMVKKFQLDYYPKIQEADSSNPDAPNTNSSPASSVDNS